MAQDCVMTLGGEDRNHATNCRYMDRLGLCFASEEAQVRAGPSDHLMRPSDH